MTVDAGTVTANQGTANTDPNAWPVKEADGANVALGSTTDAGATGNGSLIAVTKRVRDILQNVWDSVNSRLKVGVENTVIVQGVKSNNGGAPGATNLGTLPAIATAAAPSHTEGHQVGLSTTLDGKLRTDATGGGASGVVLHSTTSNLGASSIFTGAFVSILSYAQVTVNVKASHDSAADGLVIDWSDDGTTVHRTQKFSILANVPRSIPLRPKGEFFRVVYTNGGTAQTSFSLETIGHLGAVREEARIITVRRTLTISTTSYSGKDNIGGKLEFTNVAPLASYSLTLRKLLLYDADNERKKINAYLFRSNPNSGGTVLTDNSEFDLADADLLKVCGIVRIDKEDYYELMDNAVALVDNLNIPCTLDDTSLWVALRHEEGATYSATTDLSIELTFAVEGE